MSDFLDRLARRTLELKPMVRPLVVSRYAPWTVAPAAELMPADSGLTANDETVLESATQASSAYFGSPEFDSESPAPIEDAPELSSPEVPAQDPPGPAKLHEPKSADSEPLETSAAPVPPDTGPRPQAMQPQGSPRNSDPATHNAARDEGASLLPPGAERQLDDGDHSPALHRLSPSIPMKAEPTGIDLLEDAQVSTPEVADLPPRAVKRHGSPRTSDPAEHNTTGDEGAFAFPTEGERESDDEQRWSAARLQLTPNTIGSDPLPFQQAPAIENTTSHLSTEKDEDARVDSSLLGGADKREILHSERGLPETQEKGPQSGDAAGKQPHTTITPTTSGSGLNSGSGPASPTGSEEDLRGEILSLGVGRLNSSLRPAAPNLDAIAATLSSLHYRGDISPQSASPPSITVTIGSIEVRAVPPAQPEPRARPEPTKPAVSLDDYLKQRQGGAQ